MRCMEAGGDKGQDFSSWPWKLALRLMSLHGLFRKVCEHCSAIRTKLECLGLVRSDQWFSRWFFRPLRSSLHISKELKSLAWRWPNHSLRSGQVVKLLQTCLPVYKICINYLHGDSGSSRNIRPPPSHAWTHRTERRAAAAVLPVYPAHCFWAGLHTHYCVFQSLEPAHMHGWVRYCICHTSSANIFRGISHFRKLEVEAQKENLVSHLWTFSPKATQAPHLFLELNGYSAVLFLPSESVHDCCDNDCGEVKRSWAGPELSIFSSRSNVSPRSAFFSCLIAFCIVSGCSDDLSKEHLSLMYALS